MQDAGEETSQRQEGQVKSKASNEDGRNGTERRYASDEGRYADEGYVVESLLVSNFHNRMDAESTKILNEILAGDKDTMSEEAMHFVMARRSYLNDEQRKRFEKEIKLHEAGKLFPFNKEEEGDGLEGMSMKDLAKKAKELGIKGYTGMDKKALIRAIEAETEGDE